MIQEYQTTKLGDVTVQQLKELDTKREEIFLLDEKNERVAVILGYQQYILILRKVIRVKRRVEEIAKQLRGLKGC